MTTTRLSAQLRALGMTLAFILAGGLPLSAQTTAASTAGPNDANQDETVVLSPFVVNAAEDAGRYQATSTLAGTRVRTDLKDVASSLSVVTSQFLKDTGATNNQTLLQYTANTEVGGIYGNFAGVGATFTEGATENFAPPHLNTRVRGLDSADNTRDYFRSDIPWDSYNVGRVDIQRGPNSILFGIGSPAGIINASVNTANFKNTYSFENRVGSYGTVRDSVDLNQVVLDQQLAVRLALLDDHTQYRQDPAFSRDKRLFGALRFEPEQFNRHSAHTSLRANFERGSINANQPRVLPPGDFVSPFFDLTGVNKTAVDPYFAWVAGLVPRTSNPPFTGETRDYWLNQNYGGAPFGSGPTVVYGGPGNASATGPVPSGNGVGSLWAIGPDGLQDKQIDGYPFAGTIGIGNYNQYTISANQLNPGLFPGASSGFYKSRVITDRSLFDFYDHLIDGPNKREWQDWTAYNLTLDQTFFSNRLGFQVAYDKQNYNQGSEHSVDNLISVDVMANINSLPWAYPGAVAKYNGSGQAGTNPNAGRAYIAGSGAGGGFAQDTTRESLRVTGTGELRATDLLHESWLTDVLGRHVFTALYSNDTYEQNQRTYDLYAMEGAWDATLGTGSNPDGSGVAPLTSSTREVSWISYISDPLFSASGTHNLRLQPFTSTINPTGPISAQYFDSHWKPSTNPLDPTYVDPAAPWTNPVPTATSSSTDSTQSENPANYVGWRTGNYSVLNVANGDINSLYRQAAKLKQDVTSEGLTWQANLWDDMIAATYGWRRDVQTQRSGNSQANPLTGAADLNFGLAPGETKSRGISRSWGIVLHEPKAWRDKLPWGTNFSLIYDRGENTRVENRYAFDGSPLPNAKGKTTDYGFSMSTLNDRLQLKVIWYKTEVKDANLSSVLSSQSTLGTDAYYQWLLPPWALTNALQGLAGLAGDTRANGFAYVWNWAAMTDPNNPASDPSNPGFQSHPEIVKEKAAIASFLDGFDKVFPQEWWDKFGYPVNVAEAKAGHYDTAIAGWTVADANYMIPGGNGTVNGVPPVGTVDYVSKGIEFEIIGQVTKNWNVALNASKQNAYQSALGQQLVDFITKEEAFYATPAGDIRLWWGGDLGVRDYFEQSVGAAFRFQQQTNGKMTPEMAPWRFNGVTTYTFDHGFFKNAFVGAGYRWEQGHILGYALNAAKDNLDVDRPYWSDSQSHTDLWIGYERKLTRKLDWRIQFNVRSVGEHPHLDPLSVQPDGSPALYRIEDGMTWTLTNTFSF
jgi:outer membrane receptor protein involved in Fe transport